MSIHPQLLVPLVTLVETEPPTVIKNEPLEEALEEEISTDIKDIEIVYHPLSEDLIKNETVLEDILENEHLESVQAQALKVKTENSPFIKTENITQRNKSEDTSDGNVSKGTGQGVVEVQGSKSNLETHEQFVLNSSNGTTSWEKEKIKIIKARDITVESHEYTSLAEDEHVCKHCQLAYNTLRSLKNHIRKMHGKVTTMYQCPYCPYKSKWKHPIKRHIIQKHKDTKDIQWCQCNLCEKKFKLKGLLTEHMKVHLRLEQMQDRLDLKRYHCNNCDYKTDGHRNLKRHNLVHLKPEETQYFNCYHCYCKTKRKEDLKRHIFRHHFKNVEQKKRMELRCNFRHGNQCDYKTYTSENLKKHKLVHLKAEEIQYFYCYYCSYKAIQKVNLKVHIFGQHFKNAKQGKRLHCNKCNYKTCRLDVLKRHKLTHLKPEEIQYFYCYHCSYKAKQKENLKEHIFIHFKKEQVKFDCYICNFMTPKRESIIKHIKKHSKIQNKSEINEGS